MSAVPSRRRLRRLLAGTCLSALLSLAGCHAVPGLPLMSSVEIAGTFGYADKRTGDDAYEISYLTPPRPAPFDAASRERESVRAAELARDLALWRAAELAKSLGYGGFRVVDRRNDVQVDTHEQTYYPPYYTQPYANPYAQTYGTPYAGPYGTPYASPMPPVIRSPLVAPPFGYPELPTDSRMTRLQARVTLQIVLERAPGAGSENADAIAQAMRTKYPTALADASG
jgi:hypothetical protein